MHNSDYVQNDRRILPDACLEGVLSSASMFSFVVMGAVL